MDVQPTRKRKAPPAAWKPGQSGNPAGRPPGVPALATAMRVAVEERKDELVRAMLDRAVAGHPEAMRLVAERFAPTSRATFEPKAIPGLDADALEDQVRAVRAALARGDISADYAAATLSALRDGALAERLDSLTRRLQALESAEIIEMDVQHVDGPN